MVGRQLLPEPEPRTGEEEVEEEEEEKKEEKSNIGSQGCAAASGRQPKINEITVAKS